MPNFLVTSAEQYGPDRHMCIRIIGLVAKGTVHPTGGVDHRPKNRIGNWDKMDLGLGIVGVGLSFSLWMGSDGVNCTE